MSFLHFSLSSLSTSQRTEQSKTKTLRANKLTTIAAARTNPKLKWNDSTSANEIWRCHVAYITLGKRYILCVATTAGSKKKMESPLDVEENNLGHCCHSNIALNCH